MLGMGAKEIDRLAEEMGYMSDEAVENLAKTSVQSKKVFARFTQAAASLGSFVIKVADSVASVLGGLAQAYSGYFSSSIELLKAYLGMLRDVASALLRIGNIVVDVVSLNFKKAAKEAQTMGAEIADGIGKGFDRAKGAATAFGNNWKNSINAVRKFVERGERPDCFLDPVETAA